VTGAPLRLLELKAFYREQMVTLTLALTHALALSHTLALTHALALTHTLILRGADGNPPHPRPRPHSALRVCTGPAVHCVASARGQRCTALRVHWVSGALRCAESREQMLRRRRA
jgi:hypothetical protein